MDDFKLINPKELNETVWCTLRPSPIHGIGVFAIRDIKQGQKLYCHGGTGEWIRTELSQVQPEVRKLILQRWSIEKDGHPYLSPNDDAYLICFLNHSDDPNYNKFTDAAMCDIAKDSEILEDYGEYKKIIEIK